MRHGRQLEPIGAARNMARTRKGVGSNALVKVDDCAGDYAPTQAELPKEGLVVVVAVVVVCVCVCVFVWSGGGGGGMKHPPKQHVS